MKGLGGFETTYDVPEFVLPTGMAIKTLKTGNSTPSDE